MFKLDAMRRQLARADKSARQLAEDTPQPIATRTLKLARRARHLARKES